MLNGGIDILNERAKSSYPVSIGTSLALESFQIGPNEPYDRDRVIPDSVNLNDYSHFYINISTLYRNMVSAVPSHEINTIMNHDRLFVLNQEVEYIKSIFNDISKGKTKLVFYVSLYKNMDRTYPNGLLRKPNTHNQIVYTADLFNVVGNYILDNKEIEVYDLYFDPPRSHNKILVMTHYPHDLLNYRGYDKFDLLESHTGLLKTPSMFYTKLLNGKELNRIPFNKMSIQVFGDKEHFSPMSIKIKRTVLELADKYAWTQATTKDRIFYCFNVMEDQEVAKLLKGLTV